MRIFYTISCFSILTQLQWISAYQLAFFPEFIENDQKSNPTPQIYFHTYPRFRCNAIDFTGHDNDDDSSMDLDKNNAYDPERRGNGFVQNIILRMTSASTGPPRAIAIYDADEGAENPCDIDGYMIKVIRWYPRKPSTQVYFTLFRGYMSHFKEIKEGDREWAIVAENNIRPGDVAQWKTKTEEWIVHQKEVRVFSLDQDLTFDAEFDNDLDSSDSDDAETQRIMDELDHNTVHSENLDEKDYGDMEPFYVFGNPKWSIRQKVPPQMVYNKRYRDWRNYRLKKAKEYRRLPIWLSEKFSAQKLRDMGYVIDVDLEEQLRGELINDVLRSEQAERFYEKLPEVGFGGPENKALDDLIWGWPPPEEQTNVDPLHMLMSIDFDDNTVPYNPYDYATKEEIPDNWKKMVTVPSEYANRAADSGFPEGWATAQILSGPNSPTEVHEVTKTDEQDYIEEEEMVNENAMNEEVEAGGAQDNQDAGENLN
ncbi:hypothetical protein TWF694_011825 [Orbilia ellipsospora]|uniref:Uncharacterized protein n=1 Tax=Orbilia ellipsospora TaxID=2528407 RepID=A0AAV9X7R7_9PEZI